jgi:hypothetical protein
MGPEEDKGAVSAAWGVLVVVLGSAAIVVWQNVLPQGYKFPVWSAWLLSVGAVISLYFCFAPVYRGWSASHKRAEKDRPESADAARQVISGAPGAFQPGGNSRVRMRDFIIMNPSLPGPAQDGGEEDPKVPSG